MFLNLAPHSKSDLIVKEIFFSKLVPLTHAHHISLCLQTRQLRTPWAQVRGGRVSIASRARSVWFPSFLSLCNWLHLGSPADRGRFHGVDHRAD